MRAVEGSLGHPSNTRKEEEREKKEKKGGLTIPRARATRGRVFPSLN